MLPSIYKARSWVSSVGSSPEAVRRARAVFSAPPGGAGYYGTPGFRWQQVLEGYRHWSFVAIGAYIREIAGGEPPQVGRLVPITDRGPKSKALKSWAAKKWVTKALGIPEGHDFEPFEYDDPMVRLFSNPNGPDVAYDLWAYTVLFHLLTGYVVLWVRRNQMGMPIELWPIPTHWIQNLHVERGQEGGNPTGYRVMSPWGQTHIFPFDECVVLQEHSPLSRYEGYAVSIAIAEWLDTYESMVRTRLAQFKNGAVPNIHVSLGETYSDPDEAFLARFYAKWFARFQGENQAGLPLITGPDIEVKSIGSLAPELFIQGDEMISVHVLAAYGVPKGVVGIEPANDTSAYAPQNQFCRFRVNPMLTYYGQVFTEKVIRKTPSYEDGLIHWKSRVVNDPAQVNSDIASDLACILPGQEIQGRIIGGSKARYSGEAIKIRTVSGVTLSVTRNHPVLTMMGFAPAGQLEKGQNLLRYVGKKELVPESNLGSSPGFLASSLPVRNPLFDDAAHSSLNEEYTPATAEEVFETLLRSGMPFRRKVATVGIEFHGDAERFKGEVHVVGSYCKLRNRVISKTAENLREGRFIGLRPSNIPLASSSYPQLMLHGKCPSPHCLTELFSDAGAKFWSRFPPYPLLGFGQRGDYLGLIHSELGRFRSGSSLNACEVEFSPQPYYANSQISGDCVHRLSSFVASGKNGHIWDGFAQQLLRFGSASNLDVSGKQTSFDDPRGSAELARELVDMFPREVLPDKIVDIEVFHYDGPVYDFESPLGYIIAESLLISNCGAITPNEVRAIRGRPAYEHGGDDPLIDAKALVNWGTGKKPEPDQALDLAVTHELDQEISAAEDAGISPEEVVGDGQVEGAEPAKKPQQASMGSGSGGLGGYLTADAQRVVRQARLQGRKLAGFLPRYQKLLNGATNGNGHH